VSRICRVRISKDEAREGAMEGGRRKRRVDCRNMRIEKDKS